MSHEDHFRRLLDQDTDDEFDAGYRFDDGYTDLPQDLKDELRRKTQRLAARLNSLPQPRFGEEE